MGQSRLTSDCQLGQAHTPGTIKSTLQPDCMLRVSAPCYKLVCSLREGFGDDCALGLTIVAAEVSAARESGLLVRGSCTMEWGATSGVQLRKM